MFDSGFYLHQVQILHLDAKVENVQLRKSTSSNLKKKLLHEVKTLTCRQCHQSEVIDIFYILTATVDGSSCRC